MPENSEYPESWLERIPAMVYAPLKPGKFKIILFPEESLARGGIFCDIPADLLPPDLRAPSTDIWVNMNEKHEITKAWRRDDPP